MKSIEIYNSILKKIESGQYHADERLPHTLELAGQYKVSHTTIFKALTRLAKEGWVRRVKSKGTFVNASGSEGYFKGRRDKRIGMLFRGRGSSLYSLHYLGECFTGAEGFLDGRNRKLIPIPMESKSTEEYVREIEAHRLSGAILNAIHLPALHAALKKMRLPYVCADYLDYNLPMDQVTTDHLKAGSLALGKLVELGHKKILFFGNYLLHLRQNDPDHEYWWTAVQSNAKVLRLKNVKSLFLYHQEPAAMKRQIRDFVLAHGPWTGYICGAFFNLLQELLETEAGLKEEVRDVVVFTDQTEALSINGRPVFRCRWDTREMGRKAAEILCSILEGGPHKPQIHYLPVEMV